MAKLGLHAAGRVADALVELLESGEPEPAVAHLAPGAVLWHNSDHLEMDAVVGFNAIRGLHALVDDVKVDVVEHSHLANGFLLRYALLGTVRSSARPLTAHNCIVVRCDQDQRITRVDEYVDPTFAEQLGIQV